MLRAGRLSEAEVAARSQTGRVARGLPPTAVNLQGVWTERANYVPRRGPPDAAGQVRACSRAVCKTAPAPASGWRPGVGDVRVDERACRLSRLSHRLVSRGRIQTNLLDNRQTLTCAPGPRRTHRTSGTRLRIRRVLVRVPSEQSLEASNQLSNDRRSQRRTPVDVPGLLAAVSREDTKA